MHLQWCAQQWPAALESEEQTAGDTATAAWPLSSPGLSRVYMLLALL